MKIRVEHMADNGKKIEVRKMTRAEAGRLGGKVKVKKGYGVNPGLAKEMGRLGGLKAAENRKKK